MLIIIIVSVFQLKRFYNHTNNYELDSDLSDTAAYQHTTKPNSNDQIGGIQISDRSHRRINSRYERHDRFRDQSRYHHGENEALDIRDGNGVPTFNRVEDEKFKKPSKLYYSTLIIISLERYII